MAQNIQQSKAWYHFPLVWMMVLIPFTAVVMGVVMIWLAIESNDGLVVDDYYKKGLEINQVLDRQRHAVEYGLHAKLTLDETGRVITGVFSRGHLKEYPETLHLLLQHATRENSDIRLELSHGIGSNYIGQLPVKLSPGVWYFIVSTDDWKIGGREYVEPGTIIQLQSEI